MTDYPNELDNLRARINNVDGNVNGLTPRVTELERLAGEQLKFIVKLQASVAHLLELSIDRRPPVVEAVVDTDQFRAKQMTLARALLNEAQSHIASARLYNRIEKFLKETL
jgi:hypothetical protein